MAVGGGWLIGRYVRGNQPISNGMLNVVTVVILDIFTLVSRLFSDCLKEAQRTTVSPDSVR